MSDEIEFRGGFHIRKDSGQDIQFEHTTKPTTFKADLTASVPKGPTPGSITATVAGVNVDLSQLTTPGFCWIMNHDPTNYVEYGIWDPEGSKFYPLGELGPMEFVPLKLSRNIQREYMTGTGTTGADTNRLRIKANTASCEVSVNAFER